MIAQPRQQIPSVARAQAVVRWMVVRSDPWRHYARGSGRIRLPAPLSGGRRTGLTGGVAVVIDVLRATTTIVTPWPPAARCVRPCAEVEEARRWPPRCAPAACCSAASAAVNRCPASTWAIRRANTPPRSASGNTLVLTTTNGTRALLRAAEAERVLVAAFVNYSAVCEQLRQDARPIHIVCAGTDGEVSLEDTLLAGALVDFLCEACEVRLNDAARLAWDCFENHGRCLLGRWRSAGEAPPCDGLGYDEDIQAAAQVDRFALVPELRRDPLRVEVGAVGIVKSHWPK